MSCVFFFIWQWHKHSLIILCIIIHYINHHIVFSLYIASYIDYILFLLILHQYLLHCATITTSISNALEPKLLLLKTLIRLWLIIYFLYYTFTQTISLHSSLAILVIDILHILSLPPSCKWSRKVSYSIWKSFPMTY